jgi:phosphoglycolate phosphatase
MTVRHVLFDLDGTLIDHFRTIHRCLSLSAASAGLEAPSLDAVREAVGGGISLTIRRLFGKEGAPAVETRYGEFWERHMLDDVEILGGVPEALNQLQVAGLKLAVFTNKHGPSSRRICAHLGWSGVFAAVAGSDDTPWRKPAPEFTAHILRLLGASPADTVMVGDSPFDVQAALAGGFPCIGVTTGTHGERELQEAGARCVVPDLPAAARRILAGELEA